MYRIVQIGFQRSVCQRSELQTGEAQMQRVVVDLQQDLCGMFAGIGPGDGLPVFAQRPAGVLVCVKDGDPADAVPVRIGRQRVGQRDGTSVAQISQTALVVGVLVDDEGAVPRNRR